MEYELPKCPFCGNKGYEARKGIINCIGLGCALFNYGVPIDQWIKRPLETELRTTIAELELKLNTTIAKLESSYKQSKTNFGKE